jgi:iron-sulfur cluster insertion protein
MNEKTPLSSKNSIKSAVVKKISPILFMPSAIKKAQTLIQEKKNSALKLRAFVTGGGCSGFQYGFSFEEEQNDDDFVIEEKGVVLLVDTLSFQYLVGSKIDYKEDLNGARFVVENPNSSTTCGCGASFSV